MNLALLNPFRQADRIDSTLSIPRALHPPRPKPDESPRSSSDVGGGSGSGSSSSNKKDKSSSKKSKITTVVASTPPDNATSSMGEKKKRTPSTSASTSSSAAADQGGEGSNNAFKIPKKQKLFKQSLKLPKITSSQGGGEGDGISKDKIVSNSASSSAAAEAIAKSKWGSTGDGPSSSQTKDTMEVVNDKTTTDAKMEDAKKLETTSSAGDVEMKETGDKETPNKQKKKRKKRVSKAKDSHSSDEEEEASAAAAIIADNPDEDEEDDDSENYWTACYAVSFNRRGSFLASGHASGLIPVHDFLGRTMSALYWPPPGIRIKDGKNNGSALLDRFVYDDKITSAGVGKDGGTGGKKAEKEKKKRGPKPKSKKKLEKEAKERAAKEKKEGRTGDGGAATAANSVAASPMSVKISASDDLLVSAAASSTTKEKPKQQQQQQQQQQQSITPSSSSFAVAVAAPSSKAKESTIEEQPCNQQLQYANGVTSLSWDRRSRTLLAGAIGDKNLRLMDNTHPLVSTDCTDAARKQYLSESGGKDGNSDKNEKSCISYSKLEDKKDSVIAMSRPVMMTLPSMPPSHSPGFNRNITPREEMIPICLETVSLGKARLLRSNIVSESKKSSGLSSSTSRFLSKGSLMKPISATSGAPQSSQKAIMIPTRRHPTLLLELPQPLGGPVQLHPRDSHSGLACMIDGSLALFYMPPMAFYETLYSSITMTAAGGNVPNLTKGKNAIMEEIERKKWVVKSLMEEELGRVGNLAYLVPPPEQSASESAASASYFITCAAFGKDGKVIWAVTKCGSLLAFSIDQSMMNMLRGQNGKGHALSSAATALVNQMVRPTMRVKVPGGAAAWQIIVSHNGKYILINSADCSLRLYDVEELNEAASEFEKDTTSSTFIPRKDGGAMTKNINVKPRFVFQDNISKAPWASCDFSGDGEYIVGGCNSYPQPGDNYKLFLWNCITGELVDQLTGPVSSLYSLSCHPTRPFIAVGTSDGLVDVWGARLDWVAFAPDFQALQQNELYEEKEDEFDIVVDDNSADCGKGGENEGAMGAAGNKGEGPSLVAIGRYSLEEEDVDITMIDKVPAFDSDSEDESDVFYFDTKVDKILSEKQPGPKKVEHE